MGYRRCIKRHNYFVGKDEISHSDDVAKCPICTAKWDSCGALPCHRAVLADVDYCCRTCRDNDNSSIMPEHTRQCNEREKEIIDSRGEFTR